ncbi:nitroimidazol reductase NimA-like FMN-containing flavoprotein (pyridoxamine 5'-phosphate oxidase superfamily) [Sediminihabitans luteus]|uniref:Nitroimidazol reductase NimA-like FMN-containing flavoprotein (Pyridoxamine 5'-phosphate oxidase superfamily) n=1 Tax=Sediminihabitans luteus TaxID=1138585 RepID=A0A2M9D001_9CELL|nr:pyridoxamine 5'-phosphate oxidase family protein [Sediminihabitans luteus]PJJ77512.1 nitroimidazol reductase NimA-like FMN-containing flavoprotein (pyridoxamine 5'-phosphate oxidase superfamily) [Sediminihabitans luteus]GII98411.1 hypothetical protein Slu03_07890 [Sediminihabitans luteus]
MTARETEPFELDEAECLRLLASQPVVRLAVSVAGEVDLFPVNHVVDGRDVLFTTAPGSKLVELTVHARVVLESDGWDDAEAWSVVVKGVASVLPEAEVARAETLGLESWSATPKPVWVRVTPTRVTGRRFARTDGGRA